MKQRTSILVAAVALAAGGLSAQNVLSNFNGPSPDGWTGVINGPTTFPNGSTAATGVTETGNDVLNLSDGGFGGGAIRTYNGLATSGFVTVSVMGRIVTDPGTLTPDPNANPGTFGMAFGLGAGSSGLEDQAFGYSRSLSTTADDTGQSFAMYAATVRADGSGDFTAFFTPEQHDHALGLGTWVAQLDDITVHDCFLPEVTLSDFDGTTDNWASTTPTNSPFGSAFTGIAEAGGELVLTDGGFTGGAFRTYTGAATSAGVHTVYVDVRIVTDSGSVDRARIAACAGGTTVDYWDLSFSQSFATAGDDSGQSFQTVAVPVITDSADDITVYVLPDYDASIGGGAWEIHIDNVRIANPSTASTELSVACGPGHHSLGGPALSFTGVPTIGGTSFSIDAGNLAGTPLCLLFLGNEIPAVPLTVIGSFPGSQGCIDFFLSVPCGGGSSASVPINFPLDPSYCGQSFSAQFADFDPSMASMFSLPLGTSQAGTFTAGL